MTKKFIVSHGWQYVWCDPDEIGKFSIREVIKGPFTKPKIAYPVPTITYCQTDSKGNLHEPPVCWVEFLNNNGRSDLGLDKLLLKKDDSMHKTYTDVNCSLGRSCVIEGQSFSQGIPDPWTSSPYKGNRKHNFSLENIKSDLGRQLSQLLRSKSHQSNGKEERCLCCQKKFLFECPDEDNVCTLRDRNYLNCSCLDCHGESKKPAHDTGKKCMCLYRNRVLEKNLLKARERRDSESDYSSRRRRSSSEEESTRENLICTCSRNRVPSIDAAFANGTGNEKPEPQRVKVWYEEVPRGIVEKEQEKEKITFHVRLKSGAGKITEYETISDPKNPPVKAEKPRGNEFISRKVQTESSDALIAKDKGRQNEKARRKSPRNSKRNVSPMPGGLPPCVQHFMYPNSKMVYSYPCSYANYFMTPNTPVPQFLGGSGKRKKKKKREKESQEELEDESTSNFSPTKKDRGEPMINKCKCSESNAQYACEKVFRHQFSNVPYDQLKLIAENKLRNYMDRRKHPVDNNKFVYNSKPLLMPSRFRDIFEGRAGDCTEEEFERYRQIYRFKPKEKIVSSSGDENLYSSSKMNVRRPRSNFNVINQMNKEGPTKIKLPKEIIESEECITYRPIRSRESSAKRIRRRRRLSKGRKRKRKSLGSRPVVLVKSPKRSPENVQADDFEVSGTDQSRLPPHLKNMTFRVAENNRKVAEMVDYCKVNNLRYVNPAGNFHYKPCSRVGPGALAQIREGVISNRYEPSEYIKRQSEVDGVLDKISWNSRSVWPCKMRTVGDDFQFKKRNVREAQTQK